MFTHPETIEELSDLPAEILQLLAINRAIVGTHDFDALLRLVIDKTAAFTGADVCLLLLAEESGPAKVAASVGLDPARAARFSAPLDEQLDQALHRLLDRSGPLTCVSIPVMNEGSIARRTAAPSRRRAKGWARAASSSSACR